MKETIVLLALLLSFPVAAQEKIAVKTTGSYVFTADWFVGFDNMGSMYYVKDEIFHKETEGRSLEYKNLALGKIRRIDLQNPLKIMLLYEDFNTIVTVDNQLNETLKVNFSEIQEPLIVTAAGVASQNRFWIYNSLTQQLGLFDYLKNTFSFIAPPINGTIRAYDTDFNEFRWIDDQNNFFVCDVYGKVRNLGKVPQSDEITIAGNGTVVFSADGTLYLYDLNAGRNYVLENIDKSAQSFFFKDQILSIFTNRGITNYKIDKP